MMVDLFLWKIGSMEFSCRLAAKMGRDPFLENSGRESICFTNPNTLFTPISSFYNIVLKQAKKCPLCPDAGYRGHFRVAYSLYLYCSTIFGFCQGNWKFLPPRCSFVDLHKNKRVNLCRVTSKRKSRSCDLLSFCFFGFYQYIPPMPPMPPSAGAAVLGSGLSATHASVVRTVDAMDAAFCRAERVTLVGSPWWGPRCLRRSCQRILRCKHQSRSSSCRSS